jgi:hypothetical protein
MLVDLMGMGKRPAEITPDSAMFRAVSVQYEQALAAAADVLGLSFDEIRRGIRTATADRDVEVACGVLAAGTVVGQILSWSAMKDGRPVLVAEEYWTAAREIPEWGLALDGQFLVRVLVEGAPDIATEVRIGNGALADGRETSGGQLAVAMSAVRAIPYVLEAPPGVVTPPVFGAYRWRETGGAAGKT